VHYTLSLLLRFVKESLDRGILGAVLTINVPRLQEVCFVPALVRLLPPALYRVELPVFVVPTATPRTGEGAARVTLGNRGIKWL
jgi:hypothetical protein